MSLKTYSFAALFGIVALTFFSGCQDAPPPPPPPPLEQQNWNDPAAMQPPPPVHDTAFEVIQRSQSGGQLVPDGARVSAFTGEPVFIREPMRYMIVVRGNITGSTRAFVLPESDYRHVREGHRLIESTIARWEEISPDEVPPPQVGGITPRLEVHGIAPGGL